MNNAKKLFLDITLGSIFLCLIDSAISALAVFASFLMVLTFFRLDYRSALIPTLIFFLYTVIKKIRENKILELEERYPQLRERLRTLRDNLSQENPVLNALKLEVFAKIHKADIDTFLHSRRSVIKVAIIITMFMMSTVFSSIGLYFIDINKAVATSPFTGRLVNYTKAFSNDPTELSFEPEYLDEGKIAELGDDLMNISLNVYNSEIDIDTIDEAKKYDYEGEYPEELGGIGQETYTDEIDDEDRELIKEYFKKINR